MALPLCTRDLAPLVELKAQVREQYRAAASDIKERACCAPGTGFGRYCHDTLGSVDLPDAARYASLGCGDPTAVAELRDGEIVLDLGSGAGLDVLLSARRVGPTGKAYGLDMTGEMIELARRNQAEVGITNVEFLEGDIEDIPLPDNTVSANVRAHGLTTQDEDEEGAS